MSASGVRAGQVDTELPAAAALADSMANPTAPTVGAGGLVWNGATWDRVKSAGGAGDASAGPGLQAVADMAWNGATWDRLRTPTVFRTQFTGATGSTALWTPTSGKKFRLLGFRVDVPLNTAFAGGGILNVALWDAAADLNVTTSTFCPAASGGAVVGGFTTGWCPLGNGILSAAANNVLNMNLSQVCTSGGARVSVAGTEE